MKTVFKKILNWGLVAGLFLATIPAFAQQKTGSQIADLDAQKLVLIRFSTQAAYQTAPTDYDVARQVERITQSGLTGNDVSVAQSEANTFSSLYINYLSELDAGTISYDNFAAGVSNITNAAVTNLASNLSPAGAQTFSAFVQSEKNNMAVSKVSAAGGTITASAYFVSTQEDPGGNTVDDSIDDEIITDVEDPFNNCNVTESATSTFSGGNIYTSLPTLPGGIGINGMTTVSDGFVAMLGTDGNAYTYDLVGNGDDSVARSFTKLAGGAVSEIHASAGHALYGRKNGVLWKYNFVSNTWGQLSGGANITKFGVSASGKFAAAVGNGAFIGSLSGSTLTWTQVGTTSTPIVGVTVGKGGTGYAEIDTYFFLEQNGTLHVYDILGSPNWGTVTITGLDSIPVMFSAGDDHSYAILTNNLSIYKGNTPINPAGQPLNPFLEPGKAWGVSSDSVSDLYVHDTNATDLSQFLPNSAGTDKGLFEGNTGRTLLNVQNNTVSNIPITGQNFQNGGTASAGVTGSCGIGGTILSISWNNEGHIAFTKVANTAMKGTINKNCVKTSDGTQICPWPVISVCSNTVSPDWDPQFIMAGPQWLPAWGGLAWCTRPVTGAFWKCSPGIVAPLPDTKPSAKCTFTP